MNSAIGPDRFLKNFQAMADRVFEQIVQSAKLSTDSNFTLDISVDDGAKPLLRKRLLEAGFLNIEFYSDYRDPDWIKVLGNPYASRNVPLLVDDYVKQISFKLDKAIVSGSTVSVDISVPVQFQKAVKSAFIAKNWKDVRFNSSQRDGDSVTLIF